MMFDLARIEVEVPKKGFEWRHGLMMSYADRIVAGPFLASRNGYPDTINLEIHPHTGKKRWMRDGWEWKKVFASRSGLFSDFAGLVDDDELRVFADLFGVPYLQSVFSKFDETVGRHPEVYGVARASYLAEIATMRTVVRLWEAGTRGDEKTLEQMIDIQTDKDDQKGVCRALVQIPVPAEMKPRHVYTPVIEPDDGTLILAAAKGIVRSAVTHELNRGFSGVVIEADRTRDRWGVMVTAPGSLLGALWLQFAAAVCGEKRFKECKACGNTFEVSLDGSRINKEVCSPACNSRAYRQRKAEAREMHKAGQSPEQIAKAVGSDAETVRGWLLGK